MNLPKPDDLLEQPHLATLFVLEAAASAALRAMAGMHPDVYQGTFPRTTTEMDHCADRLMDLCSQLAVAIEKYHSLISEEDRRSLSLHF